MSAVRIETSFTELLGIDLPIVQAPIGVASTPELAAAVCNAGGTSVMSITWHSPARARELLRATKSRTDRPFGINLVLEWDPDELLEIALAEQVRVIHLSWGDAAPYVERVKARGALIGTTVVSAEEALAAQAAGVDFVVAQGWEAGGHVRGKVATMALIPAIVDAVPGLPVLAAGGVADGRGLAAALALGAAGAWIGTRFVASIESAAHAYVKTRIADARETGTFIGEVFDGGWPNAPVRSLRNSTIDAWEAAGSPPAGSRPGEGETVGHNEFGDPIERYSSSGPIAGATGDLEAMVLYAGQISGAIHAIKPAGEIVREIANDAIQTLDRLRSAVPDS